MKAWRMHGVNDLRLDEIPLPEVKPGWVLIKVRTLQPSITDVSMLKGTFPEDLTKRIAENGPLLFGHEFCGEVVQIGDGVHDLKIGDRVFYWRRAPCGHCVLCSAGLDHLCEKGGRVGMDIPGCLAEYLALPAATVASLPQYITDSEGAALQPLVGAVGTVDATGIKIGDTVAVLGQGSMGLNVTQLSGICGAGKVIGVDLREEILNVSGRVGADIVIDARWQDPVQVVLEATRGVGADIVFECAGGNPRYGLAGMKTLSQAIRMVRDQGKVTQIAILGPEAAVEVAPINMRGLQYRGLGPTSWKHLTYTLNLVSSKRIELEPLITHKLEGFEKVPEALEITGNKAKYGAINPAQVIICR